jgi:hypothetical protein
VFSRLPENAVRSIYAVAIGDENRFGELVAVFWRRSCEPLKLKRR